jgi:hypothetical protein
MHIGLREDDSTVSLLLKIGLDFGDLKTDLLGRGFFLVELKRPEQIEKR